MIRFITTSVRLCLRWNGGIRPSRASFPLTPALSPRERENGRLSRAEIERIETHQTLILGLPLPKGEGRGEGEEIVQRLVGFAFYAIGLLLLAASSLRAEEPKPAPAPSPAVGLAIAELKRDTPVDFEKEVLPFL